MHFVAGQLPLSQKGSQQRREIVRLVARNGIEGAGLKQLQSVVDMPQRRRFEFFIVSANLAVDILDVTGVELAFVPKHGHQAQPLRIDELLLNRPEIVGQIRVAVHHEEG